MRPPFSLTIHLAKISRFGEREKGSLPTARTSNETTKGAYQKYNKRE